MTDPLEQAHPERARLEALARHSETREPLVVYQALYGEHGIWVRPAGMFMETVTVNGRTVPRFAKLARDSAPTAGR